MYHMNPKIEKIIGDIEKAKAVIAEKQAKIRDLEQQKTKLENADIVAAMRGVKATPGEFEAFLATRRGQGGEAEPPTQSEPAYQSNKTEGTEHEE